MAPHGVEGLLHGVHGSSIDERAHEHAICERVADLDAAIRRHKPAQELVGDFLLDDDATRGRAALPGCAYGAEEDGAHSHREVCLVRDDDRVVAAELEDRAPEARSDSRRELPPLLRAAGEADERYAPIRGQPLADDRPRSHEQRQQAVRRAIGLEHAVGDLHARDRGERRLTRRLPDDRIAAEKGDHRVPGPDRDREVEGRDHA